MAGLPPTNLGQQQQPLQQQAVPPPPPCLYNDPSVYVKTEYDQGKLSKEADICIRHRFGTNPKIPNLELPRTLN